LLKPNKKDAVMLDKKEVEDEARALLKKRQKDAKKKTKGKYSKQRDAIAQSKKSQAELWRECCAAYVATPAAVPVHGDQGVAAAEPVAFSWRCGALKRENTPRPWPAPETLHEKDLLWVATEPVADYYGHQEAGIDSDEEKEDEGKREVAARERHIKVAPVPGARNHLGWPLGSMFEDVALPSSGRDATSFLFAARGGFNAFSRHPCRSPGWILLPIRDILGFYISPFLYNVLYISLGGILLIRSLWRYSQVHARH